MATASRSAATANCRRRTGRSKGIQLRDHIVLSALHKSPHLTQIELGHALGLDKTTLMSQLDRLEKAGLVIRKIDPRDRRARIPQITQAGEAIRVDVASGTELAETTALAGFSTDEVSMFRRMLFRIIGETRDPGSCL